MFLRLLVNFVVTRRNRLIKNLVTVFIQHSNYNLFAKCHFRHFHIFDTLWAPPSLPWDDQCWLHFRITFQPLSSNFERERQVHNKHYVFIFPTKVFFLKKKKNAISGRVSHLFCATGCSCHTIIPQLHLSFANFCPGYSNCIVIQREVFPIYSNEWVSILEFNDSWKYWVFPSAVPGNVLLTYPKRKVTGYSEGGGRGEGFQKQIKSFKESTLG